MKAVKGWRVGAKDGGGPIATDFAPKRAEEVHPKRVAGRWYKIISRELSKRR